MFNNVYIFYPLGFLPSFIWLLFYLRKDKHPESNKMVLKIFFYGMFSALVAIFLEQQFRKTDGYLMIWMPNLAVMGAFLNVAIIEEMVKYTAAWLGAFRNKELDEPIDVMLYMVISALGFAALENILLLVKFNGDLTTLGAIELTIWRFISATFLHSLCSGVFGYWIAISFCRRKQRFFYWLIGFAISIGLHMLYNLSIMEMTGFYRFLLPVLILIISGCLVSHWFKKLKKMKSVCNI